MPKRPPPPRHPPLPPKRAPPALPPLSTTANAPDTMDPRKMRSYVLADMAENDICEPYIPDPGASSSTAPPPVRKKELHKQDLDATT